MAEPKEVRAAHDEARQIRHDAERRARDITDEARKQAQDMLAEARAASDDVLEDAKKLAESLRKASAALSAQADALFRDVQLAHRELLSELRLPGVAERDRAARAAPPRPKADEIFEPPDWVGGGN